MSDYESMTTEELEAARVQLGAKLYEIAQEQGKIASILNEINAKDAAAQKFASMGEVEKKALAQLIMGAGGIRSEEKIGNL